MESRAVNILPFWTGPSNLVDLSLPTRTLTATQFHALRISLSTCISLSNVSSSASYRECLSISFLAPGGAHRVKTRSYCFLTRLHYQFLGLLSKHPSHPRCWTKHQRVQPGTLFMSFAFDPSTLPTLIQCTHITPPLKSVHRFQTLHSPVPLPFFASGKLLASSRRSSFASHPQAGMKILLDIAVRDTILGLDSDMSSKNLVV